MPKSTSTTITDLNIDNMEQGKIYATAVVPLEEIERRGWGSPSAPGEPQGILQPNFNGKMTAACDLDSMW